MDLTGAPMLLDEVLDVVGLPNGEVAPSCSYPKMWGVGHAVQDPGLSSCSITACRASFMGTDRYFFSR